MVLSEDSFRALARQFQSHTGIALGRDKHAMVQARLVSLAQAAGCADLDHYVEQLLCGRAPDAWWQAMDRLTTNKTSFFREPAHFKLLSDIVRSHPGDQPFKAWSAACASGEEAYSMAMVIQDRLPAWAPWELMGTDVSRGMVQRAARGLYDIATASQIPKHYLDLFWLKGRDQHQGHMLAASALRQRMRFQRANLLDAHPELGSFDVIFLRNVLIYFDQRGKAEMVRRVLAHLKPQGLLVTGHTESLVGLELPLKVLQTTVYTHA